MMDQHNLYLFSVTHHQLRLLYKLEILQELQQVSQLTLSQHVNSYLVICTGGEDYDSGPYTVTFPAGTTTVPFNIPITDDNIFEGDETFDVTIIGNTLPDGVTRGTPGSATVNIRDNDRK